MNGRIIQVFSTKHVIGIQSLNGLELLIHIGLDAVALIGEGYKCFVNNNQFIKTGYHLVTVDLDFLKRNNKDTVTPVIVTNTETVLKIKQSNFQKILWGNPLLECRVK